MSPLEEHQNGAEFSVDGNYRFALWRVVEPARIGDVLFLMANPSIAGASDDDPTIRRCVGFTRSLGFRRLLVGNINPQISTDPANVITPPRDVLRLNDTWIRTLRHHATTIVCAWGSDPDPDLVDRAWQWVGRAAMCLGTCKNGQPRHPLYLRATTQLEDLAYPL